MFSSVPQCIFVRRHIASHIAAAFAVTGLGLAGMASAGVAPPSYTLTDLGALPGTTVSSALAINNAGQVVGSSGPGTNSEAFLYSGGAMQQIGNTAGEAVANGINSSGEVVGVLPLSGGGFVCSGGNIQFLPSGFQPDAINDAGQIAGKQSLHGGNPITDAAIYQNGAVHLLGAPGVTNTANAINATGQVAGTASEGPASSAFLYSNDAAQDLGSLGGPSGYSSALGLNNSGEVVGTSDAGTGSYHGFLYEGGAMYDLNALFSGDAGYEITFAVAINATGQIAADAITPSGQEHAVLLSPTAIPLPPAAWMGLGTMGLLTGGLACRRRAAAR